MKKGQVGVEYLIIIAFITLAVSTTLIIAQFYIGASKTSIKENQIENFANKIIESSESVYYSGEPSKTTIEVFLPDNLKNITLSGNELIVEYSITSGISKRAFQSNVPLNGSIKKEQGIRKIIIQAKKDFVIINDL
ncbi:MAG TPA: hypothetical protein VJ912_04075 [Candidatus Nanoarchaeia archaeon]|nr:hypothetical protein [Candidatus Nanoarchaeia archaeon]